MAIDFNTLGKNLAPKVRNTSQNTSKASTTEASSTKPSKATEQVNLSSQAQELYQANNQQGIDNDKVEAIKQQLEEGSYKINYQQLAGKMIGFESQL